MIYRKTFLPGVSLACDYQVVPATSVIRIDFNCLTIYAAEGV